MEVDPSKICGWLLVLNSGDLLRPVQFYEPAYLKKKKEPDEHWTLELFSDIIIDEAFYSTVHEQFKLNEA